MSFILEIELPNEEIKQFELPMRTTLDYAKTKIFKHTESLVNENKFDYGFQLLQTNEILVVDFIRVLSSKTLVARAAQGLPIQAKLIKRDINQLKFPPRPNKISKPEQSDDRGNISPHILIKQRSSQSKFQLPPRKLSCGQLERVSQIPKFSTAEELKASKENPSLEDPQNNPEISQLNELAEDSQPEPELEPQPESSEPESQLESEPKFANELSQEIENQTNVEEHVSEKLEIPTPVPLEPSKIQSGSLSTSGENISIESKRDEQISNSPKFTRRHQRDSARASPSGRFLALLRSPKTDQKKDTPMSQSDGRVENLTDSSKFQVNEAEQPEEDKASLIVPGCFGFHLELGVHHAEPISKNTLLLEMPTQENLYQKYFVGKEHQNFMGIVEGNVPVIVSLIDEKDLGTTRALVRIPQKTFHICIDHISSYLRFPVKAGSKNNALKSVLSKTVPSIPRKGLKKVRSPEAIQEILSFDASHLVKRYKFGVLYAKEGQTDESEWFGNEHGSDDFNEFLGLLGQRITLRNWGKFRGGLDVNGNSTGDESVFTEYAGMEIMFHVSTLLPYHEADPQKIERKRHIGNDIVVIIFKEGNTPFQPSVCKSVFNHTYIVVRKLEPGFYKIELAIKDGVEPFGPEFSFPARISADVLGEFLLVKMLNAEWAAYRSKEFSHKFQRTRTQQLKSLIKTYTDTA